MLRQICYADEGSNPREKQFRKERGLIEIFKLFYFGFIFGLGRTDEKWFLHVIGRIYRFINKLINWNIYLNLSEI